MMLVTFKEIFMAEIKETKEALIGVMKLSAVLISRFKDGAQLNDFEAIIGKYMTDEVFKKAIVDAYNDANQIPEELKDLDFKESLDLAKTVITELPEVIEALNSKAA